VLPDFADSISDTQNKNDPPKKMEQNERKKEEKEKENMVMVIRHSLMMCPFESLFPIYS
jgi:hypothetical protein